MSKPKYALYIDYGDGQKHLAKESDRLRPLYAEAAYYFDYLNAWQAVIYRGSKPYKSKLYDSPVWFTHMPVKAVKA